jgi:hypothetical protein
MLSPYVSRAAQAAGVPARYIYWCGRSGRRYLFTCTSANSLGDFDEGVAIAVIGDRTIWVGDVAALARMPSDSAPHRAAIYLHLLAPTAAARQAIIEDLRPIEISHLRLAA